MTIEEKNEQYELLLVETLDDIWKTVNESSIPAFKKAKYRTVDSEEIKELISDFKNNLPEELRRANSVLSEANVIIDDAKEHAEMLVDDAQKKAKNIAETVEHDTQTMIDNANEYHNKKVSEGDEYYQTRTVNADAYYNNKIEEANMEAGRIIEEGEAERSRLVSETEIVRAANETAEKIINEAENYSTELRRKTILKSNQVYTSAKESADKILGELMGYIGEYYAAIEKDRKALGVKRYNDNPGENERQINPNADPSGEQPDEEDDDKNGESFRFLDIFKRRKKKSVREDGSGDYDDMEEE